MGPYFNELFRPESGGLARGMTLGDTLEKVRSGEPATPYDNTTTRVLTYNYPISERSSLQYSVYYGYDENQTVRKISLSLEFDKNAEKPGSFKTFEKMLEDIHNYLEARFGEPETNITKTKLAGDEVYHSWQPESVPPMRVLEVLYANPKYGIKKAIRVDFSRL